MKRAVLTLFVMIGILLLASHGLAMSSTNYRLDWFTPLTGNAAGSVSSANYAVQFTVGESASQAFAGTNYNVCLGYWCGGAAEYRIYLPLVLRA